MPHFIIDCSENIIRLKDPRDILNAVYHAAEASGLFAEGDIKVRLNPYAHFNFRLGDAKTDFIHVFAYIMEGRSTAQKAALSEAVVAALNTMLPGVPIISMNISDFEKASYFNKTLL